MNGTKCVNVVFGISFTNPTLPPISAAAFVPLRFCANRYIINETSQVMPHDYKRVLGEMAEAKANGIDWDEDEEGKSMVA